AIRRAGHRPGNPCGSRCHRDLFHAADLRTHLRRARHSAEGSAHRVPDRAERRIPRCVHRRRPDAGQNGHGPQGRLRRIRSPARFWQRAASNAPLGAARDSGWPWLPHRAFQQRSPRPPRSSRTHARRPGVNEGSRPVIPLAIATVLGVGYVPYASGTFGSAVGLIVWAVLPASAAVHAVTIALIFAIGSWSGSIAERHFGTVDPGAVVIDEVLGMLITLFMNPVGWNSVI